ncbi:MAG: efflux RND transporter periplasmic adaptor subunit [Verrucomicrobiota bacterium]
MHPQIRQDHPGNCPICGMTLVPVRENEEKEMEKSDGKKSQEIRLNSNQIQNSGVRVTSVQKRKMGDDLRIFGSIAYIADSHIDMTSFYAGRIERVLIPYNTTEVKKGAPLLEIYSEEAILDQEKYLEMLRSRYLSTFYERRLVTSQIETVRTRLLRAGLTEDDLVQLEKKGKVKSLITVYAMNSGSIVGVLPHTGERITLESVVFHITPLDRVWFVGQVFEKDLEHVQLGQRAFIESPSNPAKKFEGKVVFLDQVLQMETRTRMVRIEVENPKRELLPQMSATAILHQTGREILSVPAGAVIETGTRALVYVEKGEGIFDAREIKVLEKGKTDDGSWVAIEGLNEGEKVASEGSFLLDAEAQIRTPRTEVSGEGLK